MVSSPSRMVRPKPPRSTSHAGLVYDSNEDSRRREYDDDDENDDDDDDDGDDGDDGDVNNNIDHHYNGIKRPKKVQVDGETIRKLQRIMKVKAMMKRQRSETENQDDNDTKNSVEIITTGALSTNIPKTREPSPPTTTTTTTTPTRATTTLTTTTASTENRNTILSIASARARDKYEDQFRHSCIPDYTYKFPKFNYSEVQRGLILGRGGFGMVYEIRGFHLIKAPPTVSGEKEGTEHNDGERQKQRRRGRRRNDGQQEEQDQVVRRQEDHMHPSHSKKEIEISEEVIEGSNKRIHDESLSSSLSSASSSESLSFLCLNDGGNENDIDIGGRSNRTKRRSNSRSGSSIGSNDSSSFGGDLVGDDGLSQSEKQPSVRVGGKKSQKQQWNEINSKSRQFIAKHCFRNGGDTRYALKRLRPDAIAAACNATTATDSDTASSVNDKNRTKNKKQQNELQKSNRGMFKMTTRHFAMSMREGVGGGVSAPKSSMSARRKLLIVGMNDLATETRILSSLPDHPNIIKLRGMSSGQWFDRDYFIIIDRLYGTLGKRLKEWGDQQQQLHRQENSFVFSLSGCCCGGRPGDDDDYDDDFDDSDDDEEDYFNHHQGEHDNIHYRHHRRRSSVITEPKPFWWMTRRRRQKRWREIHGQQNRLYHERLMVAFDLSSALAHLHEHHIIHRDLKPDNLGFDVRGDIRVFDFGLAKEIPQPSNILDDGSATTTSDADIIDDNAESRRSDNAHQHSNGGYYNFTAMCGTPRYMAPEVALGNPYNESCDVYSFAILFWQILALEVPFGTACTLDQMYSQVWAINQQRPLLQDMWPLPIQTILKRAWHPNMDCRPSMKDIEGLLQRQLLLLRQGRDESAIKRMCHTNRRSTHIFNQEELLHNSNSNNSHTPERGLVPTRSVATTMNTSSAYLKA